MLEIELTGSLAEQENALLSSLSSGVTRGVGSSLSIGGTGGSAVTVSGRNLFINQTGSDFLRGTIDELDLRLIVFPENLSETISFLDALSVSGVSFSASGLYDVTNRSGNSVSASLNLDYLVTQFQGEDLTLNGDDGINIVAPTQLFSMAGNDTINGLGGNDFLDARDGNDALEGDGGNDTLMGGSGEDTLNGGVGNDSIQGGANSDTIGAGDGNDTITGDDGRDLVFLGQGDDLFMDNGQIGTFGQDTVFGGNGNDTIEGGGGDDQFLGGAGADVINARLGDDMVFGGGGTDTISAGSGNDTVAGGNGRDLVFLNQGDDLFNDNGQGGALGQDTVFGGNGNDTIEGGGGDDQFFGGTDNDLINARLGNDTVGGGAGNDTINGGGGADTLTGGAGQDTFIFAAANASSGTDVITDFEFGVDVFQMAGTASDATDVSYDSALNEVTVSLGADDVAVLRSAVDLSGFGTEDIIFV